MFVLKDRSNFNNIIQGLRNPRTSDDNVFVSFSTPRDAAAEQTRTRSPPIIQLFNEISNNEDLMNSSNSFEEELGGLPSVLLTPTSPNDVNSSKFNIMDDTSSSSRPRKKLRVDDDNEGAKCRLSLQNKFQGLTKTQLINLLETLVFDRHPELEEEIQQMVPEPDLQAMETKLKTFKRNIYKAFPPRGSHVGSTRDVFNYRRVHSHIQAFKKECIGQGKDLVAAGSWRAVVEYVLMAWSYIDDLPTWDSPAHNTSKSSCFKTLAVQFQQALSNGSFTIQEYKVFQTRLEEACSINKHLQPCLRQVSEMLK